MLDPLEPVLRQLLAEWPEIKAPRVTEILRADYGYGCSVDLVKRNCAASSATACSSSTKSATCPWSAKPPTCSSRSSRAATNAARSSSPAHRPRGGALAKLEGGAGMLTLFGMLGDHPPKDAAGFDGFARSLQSPTSTT
jgi:hypothetical protein